jgi:hypothetical protein
MLEVSKFVNLSCVAPRRSAFSRFEFRRFGSAISAYLEGSRLKDQEGFAEFVGDSCMLEALSEIPSF